MLADPRAVEPATPPPSGIGPRQVLDSWLPDGLIPGPLHGLFGADPAAAARARPLGGLAVAAQAGALAGWAATPRGRAALVVLLQAVPRLLAAGTPAAFAGDEAALALAEQAIEDDSFDRLENPWARAALLLPLIETEGPDHLPRLVLAEAMAEAMAVTSGDPGLAAFHGLVVARRGVIAQFGHYPDRNRALGRRTTTVEAEWLLQGGPGRLRPAPVDLDAAYAAIA